MRLQACGTNQELVDRAYQWLKNSIVTRRYNSIYLPAGKSPTTLYQAIEKKRPKFLEGCKLIQIDDVENGSKAGLFKAYFQEQLPSYQHEMHYINQGFLQADAGILGLGTNGHVAFHEPGIDTQFSFGSVDLSSETKTNLGLSSEDKGITYGLGSFMKCKSLLMIISGESKQEVVEKMFDGDLTIPAGHLLAHKDLEIIYHEGEITIKST